MSSSLEVTVIYFTDEVLSRKRDRYREQLTENLYKLLKIQPKRFTDIILVS